MTRMTTDMSRRFDQSDIRRHDLDALRAFAMLLGIGLHAALSFMDFPWVVQDRSREPALGFIISAIHGFRMPLFFMLSGYFTAMLWQKRGMVGLLQHRARRIALPFLLGCVTIVPAIWGIVVWAGSLDATPVAAEAGSDTDIWTASATGDLEALRGHIERGGPLDGEDPVYGHSPLGWAVLGDQLAAIDRLLDAGADPNAQYRDQNTALHTAAFFGRAEAALRLLDAGADVRIQNAHKETPFDSLRHDRGTTEFVADLIHVPVDFDHVSAGRARIRALLERQAISLGSASSMERTDAAKHQPEETPQEAGVSPFGGLMLKLMFFPLFHHLWFLWFLCWLVAGFALVVVCARFVPRVSIPGIFVATPLCLLWLVPLTMITQSCMHWGGSAPGFGPDTSAGLVPMPHVLAHYAIFFGFGALVYRRAGAVERICRGWWFQLVVAIVIAPPALALALQTPWGRDLVGDEGARRLLANLGQVLYAWLMIFGLMGLFRRLLFRERPVVRYVSDSSYWLYLVHLPVIIVGQALLRGLDLPANVKLAMLIVVATVILLASYRYLVRHTWIGRLLNGPRERHERAAT